MTELELFIKQNEDNFSDIGEVFKKAKEYIRTLLLHMNNPIKDKNSFPVYLGKLLYIEKRIIREKGMFWQYYAREQYGYKKFRSIEIYMQIAKAPNSIEFSFLGLERMLRILRYFKQTGIKTSDPFGDMMKIINLKLDGVSPHKDGDAADIVKHYIDDELKYVVPFKNN